MAVLVGVDEDVAVGVSVAELVREAVGVDVDDAVGVSVVVLVDEAVGLAVTVGSGVTLASRTVIVPVAPMIPVIEYA